MVFHRTMKVISGGNIWFVESLQSCYTGGDMGVLAYADLNPDELIRHDEKVTLEFDNRHKA